MNKPAVTLTAQHNPKQAQFVGAILKEIAAAQDPEKNTAPGIRTFHYGGAIRGGKTIAALSAACLLAKAFPKSRWHVVRANFPDIRRTVLPSMDKVIAGATVRWRRSADDYYCETRNGSRIYMFAENFSRDKDLNRWKGLETNGFIFEQLEEIQEATFDKARERAGSWYNVVGPMPPSLILSTFNPTWNWVKEKVFDVWQAGNLPADELFIQAFPDDNPDVTAEQWKQWKKMPPDMYERFIRGNWEIDVKGAFLNMFTEGLNTRRGLEYTSAHELWISFDFNVDPMTAIIFQTDGENFFHVLKEYRIPDSDIFEACGAIKSDWWHLRPVIRVTGDSTGDNRMSGVRGHVSQYKLISELLHLDLDEDFTVPGKNPFVGDSRIYCNSVVKFMPDFLIDPEKCPWLIKDCRFAQVGKDKEGKVSKLTTGVNPYTNLENDQMFHLLDCLRYGIHVAVPDFIQIHHS